MQAPMPDLCQSLVPQFRSQRFNILLLHPQVLHISLVHGWWCSIPTRFLHDLLFRGPYKPFLSFTCTCTILITRCAPLFLTPLRVGDNTLVQGTSIHPQGDVRRSTHSALVFQGFSHHPFEEYETHRVSTSVSRGGGGGCGFPSTSGLAIRKACTDRGSSRSVSTRLLTRSTVAGLHVGEESMTTSYSGRRDRTLPNPTPQPSL